MDDGSISLPMERSGSIRRARPHSKLIVLTYYSLDSPAAYVQGLKKLFLHAQLLDEHTKAVAMQPVAPAYASFPIDIRSAAEIKLKRSSEFFASVVLTFVIRDLSQLLDKYAKKCEKWMAE